jgi:adenylate cyclase
MAYTVLGDSVNLGARVEGLTKEYGVLFIVTEFTAAEAPEYEYRTLDIVRVKGKDEPVTILEPIGLREEVSVAEKQELNRYHAALQLYKEQKFSAAIEVFEQLDQEFGERFVHQLYIKRSEHFLAQPPAQDWDGVYTFTTK